MFVIKNPDILKKTKEKYKISNIFYYYNTVLEVKNYYCPCITRTV